MQVAFLLDSCCVFGTMFYLACSHLMSAFMLLNMLCEHQICTLRSSLESHVLTDFLPRGSYTFWSNVGNVRI
ncbi:hypothetical protein CY34DRAFT_813810 [Suillus luteus UH-Slu-Lm8-n1]|uniref:Uncharacterized protein n=1 Tax=Suillus luteus UH-Slu-Lm8-n1 TaxID=930992 RepID=A0A0C9ZUT8_9AGAM|nr:hypothetical protein CY34DRAFT_813810 [Suillus luteus UH-Slu-Lm8-n1]